MILKLERRTILAIVGFPKLTGAVNWGLYIKWNLWIISWFPEVFICPNQCSFLVFLFFRILFSLIFIRFSFYKCFFFSPLFESVLLYMEQLLWMHWHVLPIGYGFSYIENSLLRVTVNAIPKVCCWKIQEVRWIDALKRYRIYFMQLHK